jgi:ATP-dependent Clp protease ATP-binding subunit ClpC
MKPEKFLERFSNHLKNALARGISLAGNFGHAEVTPAHLLAALGDEQGSLASEILIHFHCQPRAVMSELPPFAKTADAPPAATKTLPELSDASKRALEKAMLAAYERSQNHVGTEHLLYGILTVRDPSAEDVLRRLGVDRLCLEEEVEMTIQAEPKSDEQALPDMPPHARATPATAREVFTVELTAKKIHEKLDPVIGRDKEIDRLIRILSRRTKNNPVLVGEPGVGKTAIVEGLAKRIGEGRVPDMLKKKRVLSLDLTMLVAGTMYRGEFEARLKQLIDEISANPDTILFIDEIHNIVGTGSNQGTMDAANILKPALARGLLHCIGATTLDEYQKHMSEDPALERRFQRVHVDEPSAADAARILTGLRGRYEAFHGVRIADDAIAAAVRWSDRYIHDAFLPDKAIDLLDEAAAAVRLGRKKSKKSPPPAVTEKTIASILGAKLSLPAERLLLNDWEHLDAVDADLRRAIVGQDHAIDELMNALRRSALGVGPKNKPRSSFLFVGPSGVGKTALAKSLATSLYHDDRALVRLDMTEFTEPHSVSKLLGSPAGYIGYRERNRFLEELKKRPSSVIVFDEFDKAHPDVQKTLFQILDEGVLHASDGKSISFRHAIVILTANIGEELYRSAELGFGAHDAQTVDASIRAKVKEHLGRNLADRIEHLLLFRPLAAETVAKIIANAFDQFSTALHNERDITIVPDASALSAVAEETAKGGAGARSVERRVASILEDASVDLARGAKRKKKAYTLVAADGKFLLT